MWQTALIPHDAIIGKLPSLTEKTNTHRLKTDYRTTSRETIKAWEKKHETSSVTFTQKRAVPKYSYSVTYLSGIQIDPKKAEE